MQVFGNKITNIRGKSSARTLDGQKVVYRASVKNVSLFVF